MTVGETHRIAAGAKEQCTEQDSQEPQVRKDGTAAWQAARGDGGISMGSMDATAGVCVLWRGQGR
jgi:hypothetical protein